MPTEKIMVATFKSTRVAAGKPKMWKQLSIPIAKAARAIKNKYGKMMRFRSTASGRATFSPENKWTTAGEKTIPKMVITATTSERVQKRRLAKSQTSSLDFSRI